MSIQNTLTELIKTSLKNNYNINFDNIIINYKSSLTKRTYTTDIPLILSKILNKSSQEIANVIIEKTNKKNLVEKIEFLEEGLLEIFLKKEYLLDNINNILDKKRNYGKSFIGNDNKVNINFRNNNSTLLFDLDHDFKVTYIDNLARIMEFCGYNVTKEYIKNKLIFQSDDLNYINLLNNEIKKYLDTIRINFELFTDEQSLYNKGIIDELLTKLRYNENCYIKDNELWIKINIEDEQNDYLLVKKDGTYTELTYNLAFYLDKMNNNYQKIITILPENIDNHEKDITLILNTLEKKSNIINIGIPKIVKFLKEENLLKYTTIHDLESKIDINSIRYYFATISKYNYLDIKKFFIKNNDNPIYYIELTNAKICKTINKNKKYLNKIDEYTTIDSNIAYIILNKLLEFEDIVINACQNKEPNLICNYTYELSTLINLFYIEEEIISKNEIYTNERINLLQASKIVINNALNLIGIIPREEM